MNDYLQLEIMSDRLKLIPISLSYAHELSVHFTPEITRYMWPSAPKTQEEINQHIFIKQREMKNGEEISLLIIKNDSDEFLGYVSLHRANSKTPELGIWLKKNAHGLGFGYEALNQFKTWIESNLTYEYLKYPVDKKNIPSRKLAEKLGGKIEDEYTKKSESGNVLDEVEYRFYKKS
jgi:RimJ/RimL family protein N-acetyltransferase